MPDTHPILMPKQFADPGGSRRALVNLALEGRLAPCLLQLSANTRRALHTVGLLAAAPFAFGHSWHDSIPVSPAVAAARAELMAQLVAEQRTLTESARIGGTTAGTPARAALAAKPAGYGAMMASSFGAFKPRVRSFWDATTFYVESDNVPDNIRMPNLMVGITSWQQQIPLPTSYFASTTNPERGSFSLSSPVVAEGGALPVEFTGDGASATPPLEWSDAPDGTRSFAIIMHHVDPEGKTKWYWTLYNIPADVRRLPKNAQGIGVLGNNSVNRRVGYAPPHSKGPGAKTYVLTVYALSAPVQISAPPAEVNRDLLLAAMKDTILDRAELKVVYTRSGDDGRREKGEWDAGHGHESKG